MSQASDLNGDRRRAASRGRRVRVEPADSNDVTHATGTESGPGIGFFAGYGFSRVWSLYGGVSFASVDSSTFDGTYSLTRVDIGTRIHFAAPGNRAVPFVQLAFSRRSVSADYTATQVSHSLDASSPGASFGGGVNISSIPPSHCQQAHRGWSATSVRTTGQKKRLRHLARRHDARVHIGMVWFPD